MALSTVSTNTLVNLIDKQKITYGIADIDEIYDNLFYFNNARTSKAITFDHAKFYIYPRRKKGRGGEAIVKIYYLTSAYWLSQVDNSFAEWLSEQIYHEKINYEKIEEVKVSMHWNLFNSNIKKCFSFLMHIDNLTAISKYIDNIIKNQISSIKPEISIEIDHTNKKLIIDRKFEVKITKIKTCDK